MDVDSRWPGSTHDSKIYANSSIIRKMKNGEFPTILQALTENNDKKSKYLVGNQHTL